jgi:hypothetical protein
MKVELLKKIIKEAVREVLVEEFQLLNKQPPVIPVKENKIMQTKVPGNPLQNALMSTMQELSRQDYSNFLINEENTLTSNMIADTKVGLDLSNLDFVKKASTILHKSNEIDSKR